MSRSLGFCWPHYERGQTVDAVTIMGGDALCLECFEKEYPGQSFPATPKRNATTPEPVNVKPSWIQPASKKRRTRVQSELVARNVRLEDLPREAVPVKAPSGRLNELWAQMLASAGSETPVVEVQNHNDAHCSRTDYRMRKRAKAAKLTYASKRAGSTLYCWLEGGR